ncbi:hypothetical protein SAMN05216436_12286 [bacterium A37T11]|nr:hypothetical protein SAMN05216436_12286 [bacterium A37T11]
MKKDITDFIRQNRTGFDDANPPKGLWDGISAALDQQERARRQKNKLKFLNRAARLAAVVLLVGVGLLWFDKRRYPAGDYSHISPELALQQASFNSQIEEKKDSLQFLAASNPKMYQEFSKVVGQMQKNYELLQAQLTQSPNKEFTLQAMIRNLQAQMDVLSQQLQVLQTVVQKKEPINKKI